MSTKPLPAAARLKIERLERENEELRAEIKEHMRIYGDAVGELVTYKIRCEQAIKVLQGVHE
jgi:uncharacterized protein (UPF0335 family)